MDANKFAVAINKKKKTGICNDHFYLEDSTHDDIIDVTNAQKVLRNKLIKLEKYIILIEERKDFLSSNNIFARLNGDNQKLLNALCLKLESQIKAIQDSVNEFSKTGGMKHYFNVIEAIGLIKETSSDINEKIFKFLFEFELKSLDRAIQDQVELDSDDDYFDEEESKVIKDQIPFPDDIYEKSLDLITFGYLLTQKVELLHLLIHNLYKYAETTTKLNKKLKAKCEELNDEKDQICEEFKLQISELEMQLQQKDLKPAKKIENRIISKVCEVLGLKLSDKTLSTLLKEVLASIKVFNLATHFELMDILEKELNQLCSKDVAQTLDSQTLKELKESIIDFLYRLKDRHPHSNPKDESFDVFHRVMKFMDDNKLKPSGALIEEYRNSKTTKRLNLFPSQEDCMKMRMIFSYGLLNKAYSSKHEFIYFFNPDLEIQTKIGTDIVGNPCIRIGFFEKGKEDTLTAAGVKINWGGLEQGYFKKDRREYFGRWIQYDGHSYTGGYKQDSWNGNGEEEWADRRREIAYRVDGKKEGAAKFFDKNGNEEDKFYKDNKLV